GCIVVAPWPEPHPEHRDLDAEDRFAFAEELITAIRRFRKAHGLRDSMSLAARIGLAGAEREVVDGLRPEIQRLANVSTLEIMDGGSDAAGCARVSVAGAEVLIPVGGVPRAEVVRSAI